MPDVDLNNNSLERIFQYTDYRKFLSDFFSEQKKLKRFFSHRYFAQKAGFKSPSHFLAIVNGKANLSLESVQKMIRGMGLRGKKATYFETLVLFNQAKEHQERNLLLTKLENLAKMTATYKVNKDQADYAREWYYPVIRELAVFSDWNGDYKKLAALVHPQVSAIQAQEAVETLLRIGLLKCDEQGRYTQATEAVSLGDLPGFARLKSRQEILMLGVESLQKYSADQRHTSYATLALSRKAYTEAARILDETREKLMALALEDKEINRIYQVVLQAFPVSDDMSEGFAS